MSRSVQDTEQTYIPASEAGKSFGYTGDYVARLARDGRVRGRRLGRQWLVDMGSLRGFALQAAEQKRLRRKEIRKERIREQRAGVVCTPESSAQTSGGAKSVVTPYLDRCLLASHRLLASGSPELRLRALAGSLGVVAAGLMLGAVLTAQPLPDAQRALALGQSATRAALGVLGDGIAAALPSSTRALQANLAAAFFEDLWCTTSAFFGNECAESSLAREDTQGGGAGAQQSNDSPSQDGIAAGENDEGDGDGQLAATTQGGAVSVERVVTQIPAEPAPTYITNITNPVTIIREEVPVDRLVTREVHTVQTNASLGSFEDGIADLSQYTDTQFDSIAASFTTSALTVSGNADISGTLSVGGFSASSTISSAYFTATDSAATSTFAGQLSVSGGLGVGVATSTAGVIETSGSVYVGGDLTVVGDAAILGGSSSDTLTINSSINSSLIPDLNATRDLGSPSFYWDDVYIDTLNANSISAASTTIGGTQSESFTLNSDNATVDTEDINLVFYRGTVVPNALITWDSALDRFDINQPFFLQNDSSTTTVVSLDVRGGTGQTADLFRVASSTGDAVLNVTSSGLFGIGTSTPAVTFDIFATDALRLPVGTSAQRPTGNTGLIRYNTDTAQFEGYSSGAWQGLGGVIDVDQDTYITAEETSDEDFLRFYTQGSEQLTITSIGLVGIGTTSPAYKLDVTGSDGTGIFTVAGTTSRLRAVPQSGYVTLEVTNAAQSTSQNLVLQASGGDVRLGPSDTSTASGKLRVRSESGTTAPIGRFEAAVGSYTGTSLITENTLAAASTFNLFEAATDSDGDAGGRTTQFLIRGDGTVGIGDSSTLSAKLNVEMNTGSEALLGRFQNLGANLGYILIAGNGGSAGLASNNGDFRIGVNGSSGGTNPAILVDTSGQVGIGTTGPGAQLEVKEGSGSNTVTSGYSGTPATKLSNTLTSAGSDGLLVTVGRDAGDTNIINAGFLNTVTGAYSSRFLVRADGYVGIGTTSPLALLHVSGSTGAIFEDQTGSDPRIQLTTDATSGTNDWLIRMDVSESDTLQWRYDNASALSLTTGGNLGIGTTTPWRKLSVTSTDVQAALAYDTTRYSQFQVDTAGDLTLDASGGDIQLLNENLRVCDGGACPSFTATSTAGNLFVEESVTFGNGFSIVEASSTAIGVYDEGGQLIFVFDDGS